MTNATRAVLSLAACAGACALTGCLERRLHITSEPPGALVHLNDVEVGRTPCEVDFEFYGVYDVRLTLDGYEPLMTSAEAKVAAHELPVIDLAALLLPVKFKNDVRWNFTLSRADEDTDALLERARALRATGEAPEAASPAQPEPSAEAPAEPSDEAKP